MKKLVVLTGAGISAESGLSTFRDAGGLWEGHDIMEVASPEGWNANPELVLEFYNARRAALKDVVPNAAHHILAELEDTDEDRDELLIRLVDESTDQHHYVIRDDLQIHTLQHSQNPCATIFNGTLGNYLPGDNFPFAAFAADAFAADVANKVKGMLSEDTSEHGS